MMNRNNTLPISKEGFKKIGYLIAALLLFTLFDLDLLQLITFILLLITIWIFRNPERSSAYLNSSDTALSICDGTIIEVQDSELLNESEYKKVVIESSFMDVGLLRAPFDGVISNLKITRGAHLKERDSLCEAINERATYVLNDIKENTLFIEHTLFDSIHPIDIHTFEEENIIRSARYGFMYKGRTTIYLPRSAKVSVSVGNEVLAGETILAYL